MTQLSAVEQFTLKKLIHAGRMNVQQAEELIQLLDLHRANDPDACITDLLIERKIVTPTEVNKLLWEAEQAANASTQQSAPRKKARPRRIPRTVAPKPKDRTPLLIGVLFLVGTVGGIGFFLYHTNSQAPTETSSADETRPELEEPQPSNAPVEPTTTDAEFSTAKTPEDTRAEDSAEVDAARLRALRLPTFRMKLDALAELLEKSADGEAKDRVQKDYDRELMLADAKAQGRYEAKAKELTELETKLLLRDAIGIYSELLDEYGARVLNGEFQREYDRLGRERTELWREDWATAQKALREGNFSLAKSTMTRALDYGEGRQIVKAQECLERIAEKAPDAVADKSDDDGHEEIASPPTQTPKPQAKNVPAGDRARVQRIANRLEELFKTRSATLEEDGTLSIRYPFSAVDPIDAEDWLPPIPEAVDRSHKVRWTHATMEDELHGPGLKIADHGVYLHNAKIKPPLKVRVDYFVLNGFNKKNVVSLCWVDSKGKGVGGNFGRQVCSVKKYRIAKKQPSYLPTLGANRGYQFELVVDAVRKYSTSGNGHEAGPAPIPKKMQSGQIAVVWDGSIAGVIYSLSIEGKLDLEWAEKQLKIK